MRLTADDGGSVAGYYAYADGTLNGRIENGVLKFRYKDVKEGEGEFRVAQGGRALGGRWRADGEKEWKDWNGLRADPVPGRTTRER